MDFGKAINALKQGKKVYRKGWNGKNMFLWLKPAATINAEWCKDNILKEIAEQNGGTVEAYGTICMKTADNKVLTGWLASQTDILSEDWYVYEPDVIDWDDIPVEEKVSEQEIEAQEAYADGRFDGRTHIIGKELREAVSSGNPVEELKRIREKYKIPEPSGDMKFALQIDELHKANRYILNNENY